MFNQSSKAILHVTAADLAAWQAEIAALQGEIKEREQLVAKLRRKLELVRELGGEVVDLLSPAPASEHGITETTTLAAAAKMMLAAQRHGVTGKELADLLRDTPIKPKIVRSPGAIYTAVKRLVELGEAVQHGLLIYAPTVFERVKSGELIDPRFAEAARPPRELRQVILDAMDWRPDGMTAAEVREALKDDPDYGSKVQARPQYIYNILHRMVESTQLRKDQHSRFFPVDNKTASQSDDEEAV